jgi:hypothetical protein
VDGEFFLEARNFAGGGTAGIRGQRVSTGGAPIGVGITIATDGAPAPAGQVCFNPNDNQYLATWRDQTSSDLKGRIINADGSYATAPFQISAMFPESGLAASVAFDPAMGRYLVIFSEFSAGGVFGQFVSAAGAPVGPTITIASGTSRLSPFVAFDALNDVYLVSWSNSDTGAVWVQLLDSDGSLAGDPIDLENPGWASGNPRIVVNTTTGGFVITFVDHVWEAPGSHDVLAQIVAVQGAFERGDMNCDGTVDGFDIDPFIMALADPAGYMMAYPHCEITLGDINCDGTVDGFDVDGFVQCVASGECPPSP